MKKLDFTAKYVINCVDNEPALWDTEFTDVHPEITARIDSYNNNNNITIYKAHNVRKKLLRKSLILHPKTYVSIHVIGFHFWKHSAIRIISVSVSNILFNPCGVFPFLHGH